MSPRMSKAKRTERETKDHITVLEYGLEESERELATLYAAKEKTELKANERANRLAARAHEHVKRTKAARALIAELDDYTDACVVKEQASQIVDILIASARSLSFETWLGSTRERPDDQLDGAKRRSPNTKRPFDTGRC
jgi:hypothetical protein